MEVLEWEDDFSDVEEGHVIGEEAFAAEEAEDFAALDVLKRQVYVGLIFETLSSIIKEKIKEKRKKSYYCNSYRLTMNGK